MSALRMIAWSMVEPNHISREMRVSAAAEAAGAGLMLSAKTKPKYTLWGGLRPDVSLRQLSRSKRPAKSRPALHTGSFQECCRRALEIIEPHNYPPR